MLQFIARPNDRFSVPELVQMAIEGGCSWVQLDLQGMDEAEIREIASEVVPLCKESSTILTIVDHIEMARELGIHGFLITDLSMSIQAVREANGPEAIIGVQVDQASDVLPLRNMDIDYVAFRPDMPIERLSENVEALRNADIMLPLVASGNYTMGQILAVKETRVNGMALDTAISSAKDPVEATIDIIRILKDC